MLLNTCCHENSWSLNLSQVSCGCCLTRSLISCSIAPCARAIGDLLRDQPNATAALGVRVAIGLGEDVSRASQAQDIVGAVLDERGARIAEQLLDRIFLAQPVAAENLHGVAGHLECGLGAEGLRGDGMLERRRA